MANEDKKNSDSDSPEDQLHSGSSPSIPSGNGRIQATTMYQGQTEELVWFDSNMDAFDFYISSDDSFDTETLLSTSLPSQVETYGRFSEIWPKSRRRHSDDTDLLLQPLALTLPYPQNTQHLMHQRLLDFANERCEFDTKRVKDERNPYLSVTAVHGDFRKEKELLEHSAILARHGISYNDGNGDQEKSKAGSCRDAADRLLDAMDKQLGDVMLKSIKNEDFNDDPGTDLDSVRSLRDRVMSDLAEEYKTKDPAPQEHRDARPTRRDSGSDIETRNTRRHPTFRSASASRYEHRDREVENRYLQPATKSLAVSLESVKLPDESQQSKTASARNASDNRRGREYERSRDRRRLNDLNKTWDTPLKLSLRDLDGTSSSTKHHSSGYMSNGLSSYGYGGRHSYSNCEPSYSSQIVGYYTPQRNTYFSSRNDNRYRPQVEKWHSTPLRSDIASPVKFTSKMSSEEDTMGSSGSRDDKGSEKKVENKEPGTTTVQEYNSEKLEQPLMESVQGDGVENVPLTLTQRLGGAKQDEYEWRMKKMLIEQQEATITPAGKCYSRADEGETECKYPLESATMSKSKDDTNFEAELDVLKADEISPKQQLGSNIVQGDAYPSASITHVYKGPDYHEVPEFAANGTTKTTTSGCTEPSESEHNTETHSKAAESLGEVVTNESKSSSRSSSQVQKNRSQKHEDVYKCPSSDSSHPGDASVVGDGRQKPRVETKEVTECTIGPSPFQNCYEARKVTSESVEGSESSVGVLDSTISNKCSNTASLSCESAIGGIDKEDTPSLDSDSTIKDTEESSKSESLKTSDVPEVLRKTLVRSPSDEHSSLEFTLHVSSTDLESLPTSEFESNWKKRQKTRFPELAQDIGSPPADEDPFSSISPRSKKKLTKRERMKIALAASERRRAQSASTSGNSREEHSSKTYSGSLSPRSVTTDDLLVVDMDGDNFVQGNFDRGGRQSMPRSSSVASLSTVQTEDYEDRYKQMMVRHLAGVPVTSFDSVTIASDLDSVHTETVREQFLDTMKKHRSHDSSTDTESTKQASNESNKSQRLRDRFSQLQEKTKRDDIGNGNNISHSSNSSHSPIKASYRSSTPYAHRKSDSDILGSRMARTNDSTQVNASVVSTNGVLPNRCRTPHLQASDLTSTLRPSSTQTNGHHTRHLTDGGERMKESSHTYYANDTAMSLNSTKTPSRRSQRSESSDSDRRRMTSTALDKLQELDSQIEEIEHKKKKSEKELQQMENTMEGHRLNLLKLEEKLRDNQAKADDARTELMVLEFKRDQCRKELEEASDEYAQIRERAKDTEDLGMSYDEIIALVQERDELRARFRRGEASRTTIAERQELERALHLAKEDLFRERKTTREKLEELEEKLEERNHHFEVMESEKNAEIAKLDTKVQELKTTISLAPPSSPVKVDRVDAIEAEKRHLYSQVEELKKQLQLKDKEIVSLATETNRKREEGREAQNKIRELESKIAEEIRLREKLIAEAERNVNAMKKDKEQAVSAAKQEKDSEIGKVLQDIDKEKSRAVLEYKSEHQEEMLHLRSVIESKERELEQIREHLTRQEDEKRALGEKLRMEAKEQVRSVLAKERLSWEQEKQITDQQEDDVRKVSFEKEKLQLCREVEEARNKCKIATDQIARLRGEIEDLRMESRKLLQEKLDAVAQARDQERKDQNKKLDQLRSDLEDMNKSEVEKHRNKCAKLEEELKRLKQQKNDAVMKSKETASHAERSERCFTAEIYDECQKIGDLIRGIRTPSQSRNRGATTASRSSTHLSRNNRPATADGAVTQLRALSDDVRATIRDLTTEVETHRRAAQIAQRERDKALSSGSGSKASISSGNQLSQQIAQLNGHNSEDMKVLRKQLVEKDNELREIQRNMCMWKDTTAQKLAQKFEEELELQIERRLGRYRLDHQRQIDRMESELARYATGGGQFMPMHHEYESPTLPPPAVSSTPAKMSGANGTNDKSTVKLLRHLQGRVKQLRAENDLLRSSSQIMDYESYRKSR